MEQALAAIHQANPRRLPIHLEFGHHHETVGLACSFPSELRTAVEQQLFAQYPDCKLDFWRDDGADSHSPDHQNWAAELKLRPDKRCYHALH